MKITVLRQMRYKDTFIYVEQFGIIFRYLVSYDGEIYQDNISLRPMLWRWVAYYLRIVSLYTSEQVKDAEKIMLSGAVKTIDTLIKKGETRADKRRVEKQKTDYKDRECTWQARQVEVDDGGEIGSESFWLCLIHNELVRAKDGVKPSHK